MPNDNRYMTYSTPVPKRFSLIRSSPRNTGKTQKDHFDMMYDDPQLIDIQQLKRLPQFGGMKDTELQILMNRISKMEQREWEEWSKAHMEQERREDAAYLESTKDPVLPSEAVKINKGVIIAPSIVDDFGFISETDLTHQKRTLKFSLDGTKKKIYL